MIESKLAKLGLSEKEAVVYVSLLESGTSTVSEISKNTKINRSTSYVLLEGLSTKGLVSITDRKSSRFYTAVSPERIIYMCEERVKASENLLQYAKTLLPELRSKHKGVGVKPKIQFFEGEEGIKSIYEDTLTSGETIRAYASIDDMHAVIPGYFPEYYKRRAGKGIHIRAIFPDTPAARDRIKHNTEEAREVCLVPSDRFAFTPEIKGETSAA